eukprot:1123344_1
MATKSNYKTKKKTKRRTIPSLPDLEMWIRSSALMTRLVLMTIALFGVSRSCTYASCQQSSYCHGDYYCYDGCCSPDFGCFGGTNTVIVKRNDVIQTMQLKDLMVGDNICGRSMHNRSNDIEWTTVWHIDYHHDMASQDMLYIGYQCFDDDVNTTYDQYITMTANHLLYTVDEDTDKESMIRADDVQLNDTLMVYKHAKELLLCKVSVIKSISDKPMYPLTISGDIVVSNVVSSSYTKSKKHAFDIHHIATILGFNNSMSLDQKRRLKV